MNNQPSVSPGGGDSSGQLGAAERLAAIIAEHESMRDSFRQRTVCVCDKWPGFDNPDVAAPTFAAHLAEVVAEELQLTEDSERYKDCPGQHRKKTRRRLVTPWVTDGSES